MTPAPDPKPDADRWDVLVIGGALSGAAAALCLRQRSPGLKVLVVERSPRFTRRVGEATVEISSYFLSRVLGLTRYLNESHLVKQGLRFWFMNDRTRGLDDCSEIGGRYLPRVPTYQLDRATLDEEVLARARSAGAVVWRPASVESVELNPGGDQVAVIKMEDGTRTVRARWVIDASGVAALLARRNGWWKPNTAHPTTSVWTRWKGVKDWDGPELARKHPDWAQACYGVRGTATNHFVGDGWWAWCIPLKGGDVSAGVVFDQRLVSWPEGGSLGHRLKEFLGQHPVAREMFADAVWEEGDVHWRRNLPYTSSVFAGDGFALVGDAAAFLDPFYSPGLDWMAFTVNSAVELILAERSGGSIIQRVEQLNAGFRRSYDRWFEAIYRDKYHYLGDFDLLRLAFLLDLGFYYLGIASQPFRRGVRALETPVFSDRPSVPFFHLMRTYNRRFAAMARVRRDRGLWGAHNDGRRFLFGGFTFSPTSALPVIRALAGWMWLELTEGWRSWGHRPAQATDPCPLSVPKTAGNSR